MKVIVVESSRRCRVLAVIEGGNSLITHNTYAEGIDEPEKTTCTSVKL